MKKFKVKKGSGCAMCKPHKHGWSDRRTMQWIKEDEKLKTEDARIRL